MKQSWPSLMGPTSLSPACPHPQGQAQAEMGAMSTSSLEVTKPRTGLKSYGDKAALNLSRMKMKTRSGHLQRHLGPGPPPTVDGCGGEGAPQGSQLREEWGSLSALRPQVSRPLPPPATTKSTLGCTRPHLLRRLWTGGALCPQRHRPWCFPAGSPRGQAPPFSQFEEKGPHS